MLSLSGPQCSPALCKDHNPNKTASKSPTPTQLQSLSKGNCKKRVTFEHISQCNQDSGRAEWASMIVFSKGDILSVLPPLCNRTGPFQHSAGKRRDGMKSGMQREKAHHTWLYPLWDGDWLCACSDGEEFVMPLELSMHPCWTAFQGLKTCRMDVQTLPWGNNTDTLVPLVTSTLLTGGLHLRKYLQRTSPYENPTYTTPSRKSQGKANRDVMRWFWRVCSVYLLSFAQGSKQQVDFLAGQTHCQKNSDPIKQTVMHLGFSCMCFFTGKTKVILYSNFSLDFQYPDNTSQEKPDALSNIFVLVVLACAANPAQLQHQLMSRDSCSKS